MQNYLDKELDYLLIFINSVEMTIMRCDMTTYDANMSIAQGGLYKGIGLYRPTKVNGRMS